MLRIHPSTTARVAAVLVAGLALVLPASASAASRPCPTTGKTLATSSAGDGDSRVWVTRGRTYGCTTIDNPGGKPETWLLSAKPVGRLRLDGDTVAFTQHAGGTPRTARRVTAIDLTRGQRFLRRQKAVPVEDRKGSREREGTVEGLRVLTGGYVGWIANGTTVVLGAVEYDGTEIAGGDGTADEIYLSADNPGSRSDGYLGVARRYPASPAVARSLSSSLTITDESSDPTDEGYYTTAWSWSPDGTTTVRAEMSGTR